MRVGLGFCALFLCLVAAPAPAATHAPAWQGKGADGQTITFDPQHLQRPALLLFWATLLALLWSMNGDLVGRPARDRSARIIRHGESAGVAVERLLQRSIAREQVVAECWEQFRRRSPQDAQAISDEPRWGPRLRAALAERPLAGYKELSHLIAERRAAAQGLAHADRQAPCASLASPKTTAEEA